MNFEHKGVPRYAAETESLTLGIHQTDLYQNIELHTTKQMQENKLGDGERKKL